MASVSNPFKIGKLYSAKDFIDRWKEYESLCSAIESGNNAVVVAPRRFGKTWLLQKFMAESGYPAVYVDLFGLFSLRGFVQKVVKQVYELLKEESPMVFVGKYLKNFARYVKFSVDLGSVSFALDGDVSDDILIEQMYELLEGAQKAVGRRLVVILDEFQAYGAISERLPESLRSFFQTRSDVLFVFSGSMRHMIEELFFEASGVLYHSCLRIDMTSMLPENECVEYILRKFEETDKNISLESARKVYELTKGHPYFLQLLCYELWNKTESSSGIEQVEEVFDYLCDREAYGYDMIIETLDYKYLRNVLKLISEQDGDYFSAENLEKYKLPSAGALNKLLKRLTQHGILEKQGRGKYQIIDPLFERYVVRRLD
ncbi:Predicted ATPase, AAA+ ATPase superfamily [Fervidobacterium changbaicum]|uniref:ATP-binding protein n=2 Tax=Fervidobacterium TaxID=2422 RepID=A0AAI8CKC0_FERIS|nr:MULTISPECIES: ATP-binding protein [Fervidobacterium]AMW32004.1 ATP-binding protein [Fervidobacterium islandicum]QAV33786.1 ATP-binding protein [Fervidobacterium changbaicum]SDH78653.1 Predicted ATPase, AAA+ ATPase superfamily [Fervidobacterium changbaicum]